jgi:photosystem II stability/assembly factor-like uncharacterized protein
VDEGLPTPVRAVAAGDKVRKLAVACDDGFYASTTAGYTWMKLPVPPDSGKPVDVEFDIANENILYAITDRGVYRSADFGEKFLGRTWECVTAGLPGGTSGTFSLAQGAPARVYAVLDGELFTKALDETVWRRGPASGLGEYSRSYPWRAVDPSNANRAITGFLTQYGPGGGRSVLQETTDGGLTWSNGMESIYKRYGDGTLMELLAASPEGEIFAAAISPRDPKVVFAAAGDRGFLKSMDGGSTWSIKNAGLDIPSVSTVFAPATTEWVFAGTPSGLFVSKDQGETWESAHLVLQFERNTRRELGGASYIDAYWRARHYGFITPEMAAAPWGEKP